MDVRYRLVLLQFICLIWPSPPHVTVDSFVLRRRSAVDDDQTLSDALYGVERPGLSYVDDVDQYSLLPQYVEDYDVDIPGDYDDDDEVAEKLMDIIKQERREEAAEQDYNDFNDRDYVAYDGDTWAGSPIFNTEDYDSAKDNDDSGSQPAKMTLDKAQLREIFTGGTNEPVEYDEEKQTTELSKNEVKKLFDGTAADGSAEDEDATENSPRLDDKESEIEIKLPVGSETNVDKIVKSIEEVESDNDDVVGDEVVDVKETVLPDNGKKLTKEWMVELVQTDPPHLDGSGRKSKRSMDVQSEEEDFEVAAKQRAVDLLKTYIELQEEENRHLTEALNLATLAQTQRTDRYIDDEVSQLRQAVSDEAAIETLRDMIRADENVDDDIEEQEEEDETEQEEEEEEEDEASNDDYDNIPALDYVPVKRDDLSEMLVPASLADEDADFTDDEAKKYQLNVFLRERLRQYLLKKELESIQNLIDDDDDYDVNNQWLMSKLSPSFDNIYSDSQLNPFTREIEEVDKRSDNDYIDEDSEDDGYIRDPSWLKDLETAAAIAKLHDTTQVSNAYDDTEVCPAVYELTDDCLAARQRRLTLDDEATQLCNRHQFCYTCGAEFGLAADTCDEGYLQESDRLCSQQSVTGRSLGRCRGEAAGLFVIMIQEHNYTPPDVTPSICRQRCAYDFIVAGR